MPKKKVKRRKKFVNKLGPFRGSSGSVVSTNYELRENMTVELREDLGLELRE